MNHGSDFQNLWKQLRNEVRALQIKGYYGDGLLSIRSRLFTLCLSLIKGYWSAGTRLADSSKVVGQGVESGEFPEYMVCIRLLCIIGDPLRYPSLSYSFSVEVLRSGHVPPPSAAAGKTKPRSPDHPSTLEDKQPRNVKRAPESQVNMHSLEAVRH